MNEPVISIITPALNSEKTISDTIVNVLSQSYKNIEYIIVDNGSIDGTIDVVKSFGKRINKIIREPVRGIYPAMNAGLKVLTGDIVSILNSDDLYANDKVLENIIRIQRVSDAEIFWGDLIYVARNNINQIIRYWRSSNLLPRAFENGWMPPHPTLFIKKFIYKKYGLFREDFKIAGDYEFMLRVLYKHKVATCYIPRVLVKMRYGGVSNKSINNLLKKSFEDYRACKLNGIKHAFKTVFLKNFRKSPQFLSVKLVNEKNS